jgi:biopolymer transport protein ExbB
MLGLIGGLEWFVKGGWAMYPLALMSIWSIYIILARLVYFNTTLKRTERDLDGVARGMAIIPDRLEGELAPLLARGIRAGHVDVSRAEAAVERELQEAARGVSQLDTISQISPMFGLIGTVSGMITVFFQIAKVQGAVDVSLLANGISEALIATFSGLAVAIPAFIGYRAFRARLQALEHNLYTLVDDAQVIAANNAGASPQAQADRGELELAGSQR